MRRTDWKRRRKIEDWFAIFQVALTALFTVAFIVFMVMGYFRVISRLPRGPTRRLAGNLCIRAGERKGSHTASNQSA